MKSPLRLLTEPFLQFPTPTSIRVVWFTEFMGDGHAVSYGSNLLESVFTKNIRPIHLREDQQSRVGKQTADEQVYSYPVLREIWRHEAHLTDLTPGKRISYRITSIAENNELISSRTFTLEPAPLPGKPLKILLTSDHQIKPMVAANLQKVRETFKRIDAVFFAGDLVNIPDRASEWFDDNRGNAFFPCFQGRAKYVMNSDGEEKTYKGGQIIQNAPIFPCIGNHEVMGRFNTGKSLNEEFNDTIPRHVAQKLYGERTLEYNSFNTNTFEKIFSLPETDTGEKGYYAVSFGDIRLIVLYVTNMWRYPTAENSRRGKYAEPQEELNNPQNWGYGQHIYEPIAKGSTQYNWLVKELNSVEYQQAKYKIVMFHHPPHTLGDNIVPAYTDPVQIIEKDKKGNVTSVRYEYPKEKDYINRDLIPLLEKAKVQLVFYGHSHLWNRFVSPSGMHFLESSNVGNSYGAAYRDRKRSSLPDNHNDNYTKTGDPYGLKPVVPAIAPLFDENGQPLPYISSNEITVFSVFDTEQGTISSYRFDTSKPESEVIKFDEFHLTVDS
ncbi:Calcineurin-like phosphoesterase [Rivularia sp. PCC 7116]|uniref:purple acid phosphatase family protein n=1 Tax=Rivularia sp. PCC 7116 TaxID=373994 RepID=UPI00029EF0A0|nr:metallophosphoesterase family protein [Rivularia sp. PCC 7116]AFY54545.1 Calcineurin-like phosphoesterase [Rivularia sp. PCC 7116]